MATKKVKTFEQREQTFNKLFKIMRIICVQLKRTAFKELVFIVLMFSEINNPLNSAEWFLLFQVTKNR